MSENKIVDLGQYRKNKKKATKATDRSEQKERSLDDKLLDLIHRPFNNPGTKEELIAIYEEEQSKQDAEDDT